MGKVLKAVAVIAVAAAIAYFAPQLGLAALQALGSTAVAGSFAATLATAVVTTALGTAASLAYMAVAGRPTATTTAPGRQPCMAQPQEREGFGWRYPPDPQERSMQPIGPNWWRDAIFWPGARYAIIRTHGDCMVPVMPRGSKWLLLDRGRAIDASALCMFRPDDLVAYLRAGGLSRRGCVGLVKQFIGVDPARRVLVAEATNPPVRFEAGLDRLHYAYPVIGHYPTWRAAWKAWRSVRDVPLDW